MQTGNFIKLFFLLCSVISCANKQSSENKSSGNEQRLNTSAQTTTLDSFETGKLIPNVACKNNASISYALYIPARAINKVSPVIFFFDPHADGALPLYKYKGLADKYGFILIGSNNSKNGNDYSTADNIWSNLFDDIHNRIKIDSNQVYTCGFSGGAKVAGYIALQHHFIKGVIANSAALPEGTPASNLNFSFTGIAGEGDMNMTDVVSFTNSLDKTPTIHRLLLFKGKHEWCPESTMDIAFKGLLFDAMRDKTIPLNDTVINNYINESKQRLSTAIQSSNFIHEEEECKLSINMLNNLSEKVNDFKTKEISLQNDATYKKQLQRQQDLFAQEEKMKTVYQQQFQQGDINYWKQTIAELQNKSKSSTDEGAMYQRLLAYLSLAFYSITNQLINSNQNTTAQYFVSLYKMADATNSEAWYFSAILNARANNATATKADLLKAVENDFTDSTRMQQQPEFGILSATDIASIQSKMRKN